MRASYVDRMLAQVDGVVAPIWITELIVTDAPPTVDALGLALARLVREVERLRLCWDDARVGWRPAPAQRAVPIAVRAAGRAADVIAGLLRDPIDLTVDAPLRVTLAPLTDRGGATLLALQLHHAIGDARALMFLNRRLWQLLAGTQGEVLAPSAWSDRRALRAAATHWRALPQLAHARHRVLARRGTALRRSGDEVGPPMLRSLRVPLEGDRRPPAERFFAALLAGIAHHGVADPSGAVRFRIPVDLRRELDAGPTVDNPCSAIPIELPWADVAAARDHGALARRVLDQLARDLGRGVHWATLVECVAIARVATVAQLRSHTRPELVSARRGSTLVTTYVGTVDRYFADCPFPVASLRTHTPTWGANGFVFAGALVVNVGAFEGLWRPDELDGFVDAMQRSLGGGEVL